MKQAYLKLLDRAVATVNSPGGDMGNPDKAAKWLWLRLQEKRNTKGYNKELVKQITKEAAIEYAKPKRIVSSLELDRKLGLLARKLAK